MAGRSKESALGRPVNLDGNRGTDLVVIDAEDKSCHRYVESIYLKCAHISASAFLSGSRTLKAGRDSASSRATGLVMWLRRERGAQCPPDGPDLQPDLQH
jgi:hypothetical protein